MGRSCLLQTPTQLRFTDRFDLLSPGNPTNPGTTLRCRVLSSSLFPFLGRSLKLGRAHYPVVNQTAHGVLGIPWHGEVKTHEKQRRHWVNWSTLLVIAATQQTIFLCAQLTLWIQTLLRQHLPTNLREPVFINTKSGVMWKVKTYFIFTSFIYNVWLNKIKFISEMFISTHLWYASQVLKCSHDQMKN